LCRASTPYLRYKNRLETKDVDGWDKPGHDARAAFANLFFAVFSSIAADRTTTEHASQQIFHAKQIGFQGLRKLHE
jgi:hypothetical protein